MSSILEIQDATAYLHQIPDRSGVSKARVIRRTFLASHHLVASHREVGYEILHLFQVVQCVLEAMNLLLQRLDLTRTL